MKKSDDNSTDWKPLDSDGNPISETELHLLTEDTRKRLATISEQMQEMQSYFANNEAIRKLQEMSQAIAQLDMTNMSKTMGYISSLTFDFSNTMSHQAAEALRSISTTTQAITNITNIETISLVQSTIAATINEYAPFFTEVTANISSAFAEVAKSYTYAKLLSKAEWPLFLVDSAGMVDEIIALQHLTGPELSAAVGKIAVEHLDYEWLETTAKRWGSFTEVPPNTRLLLHNALRYHQMGHYDACVAIIMSLFDGLLHTYGSPFKQVDLDERELFNWIAEEYGIDSIPENGKRRRGQLNAKDYVVIFVMNTETGWYTWQAAGSYITKIVLANGDTGKLDETNPLRNKICHGSQTNYGTVEHSLKAILSADLIMRLGRVVTAGRNSHVNEDASR